MCQFTFPFNLNQDGSIIFLNDEFLKGIIKKCLDESNRSFPAFVASETYVILTTLRRLHCQA